MTMVSEITIENFRGTKKAGIKGLDQVNVFIGKNGAGKINNTRSNLPCISTS